MAEDTQKKQIAQKENLSHNHSHEKVLQPNGNTQELKEDSFDEDTEQDRSTRQYRSGRLGKPPRRVIEEWANDPYCE